MPRASVSDPRRARRGIPHGHHVPSRRADSRRDGARPRRATRAWANVIAAVLFAFAALTDFFDGLLARRWEQTSTLGAFLDTTADKLLVSGVLFALVAVGRASAWIAFIIVGRELLILGLRGAVAPRDGTVVTPVDLGQAEGERPVHRDLPGDLATRIPIGDLYLDPKCVMLAAAVITVASAVEYFARFGGVLLGPARAGSLTRDRTRRSSPAGPASSAARSCAGSSATAARCAPSPAPTEAAARGRGRGACSGARAT